MKFKLLIVSYCLSFCIQNLSASSSQIDKISKILAIQQATIEMQKEQISSLKKYLVELEEAVDSRFTSLKIKTELTSYDLQGQGRKVEDEDWGPRATYLWNEAGGFTGFHCQDQNQVVSGSDYWVKHGYFHRVYCRKIVVEDSKWTRKIVPD